MTPYDALMVGVIVAGMIWGALRGITWQVASLASLVLGYVVAYPVSGQVAPHLPGQPIVARAVALLVTYVAVSAGVFGVAWLIRATLRKLKFEAYDRHLGMLLGGAEGALLGSVVTLFVLSLAPSTRGPILGSVSGRALGAVLNRVEPLLPGEMREELHPFWGEAPPPSLARDDAWQDLKKPLELPAAVPPSREPRERSEPPDVRASASKVAAGVIEEGVEYLAGPRDGGDDSRARRIGRAVSDTLQDEIGRMGEPKPPGETRRRRIGRAVANLIGDELDLGSTRDDGQPQERGPQRR